MQPARAASASGLLCRLPSGSNNKLCILPQGRFEDFKAQLKAATAPCVSRCASGKILAVHADAATLAAAHTDEQPCSSSSIDWPSLSPSATLAAARSLFGAWQQRHIAQSMAASAEAAIPIPIPAATATNEQCGCSADAEAVLPRPQARYLPPARRAGAGTTILAGCRLALYRPATPAAAPTPAPYIQPHRRTPAQQSAAEEAGRPGRRCTWPQLTAGPCSMPSSVAAEAPRPAYLIALRGY